MKACTDLTGHWPQATGQRDSIHLELREHSPSLAQVAQYLGHTDVAITEDDIQHVSTLEFLNLTSILSESHVSESIYVKFEELYLVSTHLLLSVQVGAAPELGLSGFIRELPVWG